MTKAEKPSLHDILTLWYLRATKFRRRRFAGAHKAYYEGYFDERHVKRYWEDYLTALRREEVSNALRNLPEDALIADVGCGIGDVLTGLDVRGRRIGIEHALLSLQHARRVVSNVRFVNGSVYKLPLPDGSVDAAICLEVIEHLENDRAAIEEVSRIIKPGGYLVVSVPNNYYFSDYLPLTGHYRHYTTESLQQLLSVAGLDVISWLTLLWRLDHNVLQLES